MHVYKESGTEVTVSPRSTRPPPPTPPSASSIRPATSRRRARRWAPVAGHNNYADILAGPRNGLFVNISGGVRDGMAFQIVSKGGKTFHVYGTGKDRQMIEVG